MHNHEHDYVFYALEGAPLQVHDADGNDLGTLPVATGDTYAFKVEKGELISTDTKNLRVPTLHKAKNTGTSRYPRNFSRVKINCLWILRIKMYKNYFSYE